MASSLVQFGQRHVARGVNRLANVVVASAKGSHVQLEDGRKLLDFTCGIGVTNLGALEDCLQQVSLNAPGTQVTVIRK